jgi:hypothetical protein
MNAIIDTTSSKETGSYKGSRFAFHLTAAIQCKP